MIKPVTQQLFITFFALFVLNSCKNAQVTASEPEAGVVEPIHELFEDSKIFSQSITGFALYDPETESLIYGRDENRFFVPASNTKILTLYASLNALPDTLPSLRYTVQNDTLFFQGTGDPAFLNPNLEPNGVADFLKNRPETLVFSDANYADEHFGSGWSWNWYPASYAPEKSPFPIYGNMMRFQTEQVEWVQLNEESPVRPKFFERFVERGQWNGENTPLIRREQRSNHTLYTPRADTVSREQNVPFVYDSELLAEMLSDTLGREVHYTDRTDLDYPHTFYSTPADSLYRRFMIVSDNFIAEQLMLMISEQEFGEMNTAKAIEFALDEYFEGLPQEPGWSDGSGLSKYNLFTPHLLVVLLEKLMDEYGEQKTLSWFPVGGVSGTISGWYHAPEGEAPYVYAKTGTLSNTTALSGYVYTDSGRRLNFSFLNNNYVISNNAVRAEMQKVLEFIKAHY